MWRQRIGRDISAADSSLRNEGSQTHIQLPGREKQCLEEKSQQYLSFCRSQWGCVSERPTAVTHAALNGDSTQTRSLWASTGAAQKVPGTCREALNGLTVGLGLEVQRLRQISLKTERWQAPLFPCRALLPTSQSSAGGHQIYAFH